MNPQYIIIGALVGAAMGALVWVLKNKNKTIELRNIPLFRFLSDSEKDQLEQLAEVVNLNATQPLFNEGDTDDSLFVITSGRLEIYKKTEGGMQTLKLMKPGDIVGEMALLSGEARSASAKAKTQVSMYRITRPAFQKLADANPSLREIIWATYSWHVLVNYNRRTNLPKKMSQNTLQKWFVQQLPLTLKMGDKIEVPAGAGYVFLVTGSLKIGATPYSAPQVIPTTNVKQVEAARSLRIIWLPPV